MVTIIDYQKRKNDTEKEFYVLILQSGVEIIKSQSGKTYASAKKASLPSTFDEQTCKQLIGQELTGSIQKIECEPYEYVVPDTAEIISKSYRFEYCTD